MPRLLLLRAGNAGSRQGWPHIDTENFDRDLAAELQIPGAIHLAHAAGAEEPNDLVSAALYTRREGHLLEPRFSGQPDDCACDSRRLTASVRVCQEGLRGG